MSKDNTQYLWKDRKRFLGMPITFTKYFMDDDRLYLEKGFFKTETDEILLYRILDIKSSRNLWQKMFGVGTITLFSADQSHRTLELKNVKDAKNVHRFISKTVENERKKSGVAGREMIGTAGVDMDHVDGMCDTGECDLQTFEDFKDE